MERLHNFFRILYRICLVVGLIGLVILMLVLGSIIDFVPVGWFGFGCYIVGMVAIQIKIVVDGCF